VTAPPLVEQDRSPFRLMQVSNGLAVAVLAAAVIWIATRKLHAFWLDEAMLFLALDAAPSWAALLRPLPLYDQTSPIGLAGLFKIIAGVTDSPGAHKLLPILASVAVILVVAATGWFRHKAGLSALIAVALVMCNPIFAFLFGNFKHYIFEVLATALLILSWQRPPSVLLTSVTFAIALFLTNITPMLCVAVAGAALVQRRRHELLVAVVAGAIFTAMYLTYLRDITAPQFGNYGHIYAQGYITDLRGGIEVVRAALVDLLPAVGVPALSLFVMVLAATAGLAGWVAAMPTGSRLITAASALFAFLIAAALLKLFPLLPHRYSAFLLPFAVYFTTLAAAMLFARLSRLSGPFPNLLRPGAFGSVLGLGLALVTAISFLRQSERHLLRGDVPAAHVQAARSAAARIVPIFIVQPQVQLVRHVEQMPAAGFVEVNASTGAALPAAAARRDPGALGKPGAWPLLLRAEQAALGLTRPPINLGFYVEWVRQNTRGEAAAVILPTCFPHLTADTEKVLDAIGPEGRRRTLLRTACYETVFVAPAPSGAGQLLRPATRP
jgi:hypothetical protein